MQLEDVIETQLKEIELNSQIIENYKREVAICKDDIKFYTKQPVHVHKLMKPEEQNFFKTHSLRWGILYSFIMNTDRNSNLYTLEERDFWIGIEDGKLYGWSAMLRFVLLRNVAPDFDFKAFFPNFKFQYDKKKKRENYDIRRFNGGDKEIFYIGVCQFEQYAADFYNALELSGKDGITVEAINSFPSVNDIKKQKSIDKAFAEAEAIPRPHATYIYSLAINPVCTDKKVTEISTVATNNQYLQNQDHCLSTYNLMKIANYLKIPIIQFVADGNSRFGLQLMLMGAFD